MVSDNELGLFLRVRREALTPAEVGLPTGPRRRAAGLRRSEVAALADVSVEYVTRLEQGRDRHPSPQVLAALAGALRLTASERAHLYRLVKAADPGFNCRGSVTPARAVRPTVQALLDRLEPTAAVLLNRLGDIVAHTAGYDRLVRPIGLLDAAAPNLARFTFTDSRARDAYPDWAHVADEQVAELKTGPFRADPHMAALADELTLTAGDEFTRRVDAVAALAKSTGILRLAHPEAGLLRLAYETLDLSADDDQRLVVHLPADAATSAALDRLNSPRPQPLRLVAG
ncbi:helix-turn-helix protein [Asanoa ferruginea]|uniref:Helix-turn-helix protein n=1 Tax=Asanoa ferruginea TaxID=53367 RepID=A0A3D9ZFD1_9ACTN|nr:helix-turn-helix transcriptional regulator [Asanoa ferruginea]REF95975.1 helix-turn-helix protein [Asanoa ferruginea]GIF48164.1 transcriptional regulator [Asanoa ferruginea]